MIDGDCTCGCPYDEHGGDPEFPGSTACNQCEDCITFSHEELGSDLSDVFADARRRLAAAPHLVSSEGRAEIKRLKKTAVKKRKRSKK